MNTKQVIVVRKDLKVRCGKMCSQSAHAALKVFLDKSTIEDNKLIIPISSEAEIDWIKGIFTKICVTVNSEQELLEIYNKAREKNLLCSLIQDCGLTEFKGVPTYTAVAIGPDYAEKIDEITGNLSLF